MPSIDYAELTTNRVQSDACIDYAEVRRKKTKSTVTDENEVTAGYVTEERK